MDSALTGSLVNADSYNIHKGNGDYIETVGSNTLSSTVPQSGDYRVVATDGVDWRNWGRSVIVKANLNSSTTPDNPLNNDTQRDNA